MSREQRIIAVLEPQAATQGFELVTVEIAKTGGRTVLRVLLDKPELTLDDLAAANEWVGSLIDELNPFSGSYLLEVSSPGIDRPLRTLEHFARFAGEQVRISTEPLAVAQTRTGCGGAPAGAQQSSGQVPAAEARTPSEPLAAPPPSEPTAKQTPASAKRSRWSGVLRGIRDADVLLECDGVLHSLPFASIRKARLAGVIDFKKESDRKDETRCHRS
jgi:ribosome maturation factor RimP